MAETDTAEIPRSPLVRVHVLQEDIDSAIPKTSSHCMIADAIKRSFMKKNKRKPLNVSVDVQTIRLTDPESRLRYIYLTPPVCQRGLAQFDNGIKPTPFAFRLDARSVQIAPVMTRHVGKSPRRPKANLVTSITKGRYTSAVKIGGEAPPLARPRGTRRVFGMRGLSPTLEGPTQ